MKTHMAISTAIGLSLLLCAGCQNKNPAELSKEEKIQYKIDSEKNLSPAELEKQKITRKQILDRSENTKESEKTLQNAIDNAKSVLSEQSFNALLKSQKLWNTQGRGKDINQLVKNGISPADAFAKAAFLRADWIQTKTSQAMLIEMPGKFGGFYRAPINRTLEIYEMPENKINLIIRTNETDFTFTATGLTQNQTARVTSENDKNATLHLTVTQNDIITIELDDTFVASPFSTSGALIEGRFVRVKPGEIDVFTP